jgi:hypothetical protein
MERMFSSTPLRLLLIGMLAAAIPSLVVGIWVGSPSSFEPPDGRQGETLHYRGKEILTVDYKDVGHSGTSATVATVAPSAGIVARRAVYSSLPPREGRSCSSTS